VLATHVRRWVFKRASEQEEHSPEHAQRWIARMIEERPGLHLSEIELAAAGFREAMHSEGGDDALRGCLDVGRFTS
jgi:hypothetical protein